MPFRNNHQKEKKSSIPNSPFKTEPTIILPDILNNHAKSFGQFTNLATSVDNRIKRYHHEFIGMYIVKFVSVYVTLLYYYYDLLFEKIGIFFRKYNHEKSKKNQKKQDKQNKEAENKEEIEKNK